MHNPHKKKIIDLMNQVGYMHSHRKVFGDFVAMAAIAMSNSVDKGQFKEREEHYLSIIRQYSPEHQKLFPEMLANLVDFLETEPCDALGDIFMSLDMGNSRAGQFFTPYHLSQLMASLTYGSEDSMVKDLIAKKGFITVQEPTVGAGGMIVAMAEQLRQQGINYQKHMHVTAIDIDITAVHMAYIQFTLLHIPAIVVHGNGLSLEQYSVWRTPAHVLGNWDHKLKRQYSDPALLEILRDAADLSLPSPVKAKAAKTHMATPHGEYAEEDESPQMSLLG